MSYAGTFEDESGRVLIIRAVDTRSAPFRVRVVLPEHLDQALRGHRDYPFEIASELKGWLGGNATNGWLIVEAGALGLDGLGPTLDLFPSEGGGLRPRISMGLYDDWDDDFGLPWAFPLSPYRRLRDPAP